MPFCFQFECLSLAPLQPIARRQTPSEALVPPQVLHLIFLRFVFGDVQSAAYRQRMSKSAGLDLRFDLKYTLYAGADTDTQHYASIHVPAFYSFERLKGVQMKCEHSQMKCETLFSMP